MSGNELDGRPVVSRLISTIEFKKKTKGRPCKGFKEVLEDAQSLLQHTFVASCPSDSRFREGERLTGLTYNVTGGDLHGPLTEDDEGAGPKPPRRVRFTDAESFVDPMPSDLVPLKKGTLQSMSLPDGMSRLGQKSDGIGEALSASWPSSPDQLAAGQAGSGTVLVAGTPCAGGCTPDDVVAPAANLVTLPLLQEIAVCGRPLVGRSTGAQGATESEENLLSAQGMMINSAGDTLCSSNMMGLSPCAQGSKQALYGKHQKSEGSKTPGPGCSTEFAAWSGSKVFREAEPPGGRSKSAEFFRGSDVTALPLVERQLLVLRTLAPTPPPVVVVEDKEEFRPHIITSAMFAKWDAGGHLTSPSSAQAGKVDLSGASGSRYPSNPGSPTGRGLKPVLRSNSCDKLGKYKVLLPSEEVSATNDGRVTSGVTDKGLAPEALVGTRTHIKLPGTSPSKSPTRFFHEEGTGTRSPPLSTWHQQEGSKTFEPLGVLQRHESGPVPSTTQGRSPPVHSRGPMRHSSMELVWPPDRSTGEAELRLPVIGPVRTATSTGTASSRK